MNGSGIDAARCEGSLLRQAERSEGRAISTKAEASASRRTADIFGRRNETEWHVTTGSFGCCLKGAKTDISILPYTLQGLRIQRRREEAENQERVFRDAGMDGSCECDESFSELGSDLQTQTTASFFGMAGSSSEGPTFEAVLVGDRSCSYAHAEKTRARRYRKVRLRDQSTTEPGNWGGGKRTP